MTTLYVFKKPNIYLYEPWTKSPEEPLCSFISSDLEKAIKKAEILTSLSFSKGQMVVSTPMWWLGPGKGSLHYPVWVLYFHSLSLYAKLYHFYLNLFWKDCG